MIRSHLHALLFGSALSMATVPALAQAPVDIGLVRNGSEIEVMLRPNESFDELLSAVVFTVRWERASGAGLGQMQQSDAPSAYIPIRTSGGRHESGPYYYQVFSGISLQTLASTNSSFEAGKEYLIGSIPCTGDAAFEVVNDQWTGQLENNANYYVSLNGRDRTGVVFKNAPRSGGGDVFSVTPNPSQGQFNLVIPVRQGDGMRYEVVNAAGQVVVDRQPTSTDGSFREQLDLGRFGSGNYHLRVIRNDRTETHKLVVTH